MSEPEAFFIYCTILVALVVAWFLNEWKTRR